MTVVLFLGLDFGFGDFNWVRYCGGDDPGHGRVYEQLEFLRLEDSEE